MTAHNFMCEYAHAMGVGPGNTEAYWQGNL